MDTSVIIAIISGLCVAVPTILTTILQQNKQNALLEQKMAYMEQRAQDRQAVTDGKIRELSDRVEKHNNLVERMAVVERDMKTAYNKLDDLQDEIHHK